MSLSRLQTSKEEIAVMKKHFDIESYVSMRVVLARSQATLTSFALNPVFARASKLFLLEVMRQYEKTCVYYRLTRSKPVVSMLEDFIQAKSRRLPTLDRMEGYEASMESKEEVSFGLFFTTKRLLMEPKLTVNRRIVIVGASDVAIQCIQQFLLVPYLNFTSIRP